MHWLVKPKHTHETKVKRTTLKCGSFFGFVNFGRQAVSVELDSSRRWVSTTYMQAAMWFVSRPSPSRLRRRCLFLLVFALGNFYLLPTNVHHDSHLMAVGCSLDFNRGKWEALRWHHPPHTHTHTHTHTEGAGIAQWLERRTRDWKVAGSNPCWNGGRIFFSRVDFLCWLLFRYPFHPRVTTVARKRSRSFCQKCRWQVTAKHAYTLRMWLCMKWHGAWLYGVHRTCAETAAVSCGTSHASAVSTPLRWIFKKRAIKASHSCRTAYKRNESAQESGE